MDCRCHGESAYWEKDAACKAGGWWRCAVKKRAQQLETDRARADVKKARAREEHHRPDGGWLRRRQRELRKQRGEVLDRLQQLEREANGC